MKKIIQLFFLLALVPATVEAEESMSHQGMAIQSVISTLSPELQALFTGEMRALQDGMMAMVPLYVSGKLDEIAMIAGNMEDSYVLKKNLTRSQMHELHTQLPASFIEQDQHFHYLSGMLEHVASIGKTELVGFYISEMTEACVACHADWATRRFPALARKKEHSHE